MEENESENKKIVLTKKGKPMKEIDLDSLTDRDWAIMQAKICKETFKDWRAPTFPEVDEAMTRHTEMARDNALIEKMTQEYYREKDNKEKGLGIEE